MNIGSTGNLLVELGLEAFGNLPGDVMPLQGALFDAVDKLRGVHDAVMPDVDDSNPSPR